MNDIPNVHTYNVQNVFAEGQFYNFQLLQSHSKWSKIQFIFIEGFKNGICFLQLFPQFKISFLHLEYLN